MITGEQANVARRLLGWSQLQLAHEAGNRPIDGCETRDGQTPGRRRLASPLSSTRLNTPTSNSSLKAECRQA